MASIFDQSTTANLNTSFAALSLAEGSTMPSSINDQIRELIAETKGALIGVTASGTDTYTATLAPAPLALVEGMTIHIRFANANATTTPTLDINSLGAKTIVKEGSAALLAGDIPAGHEAALRYNGTNWVLLNPKNQAVATSRQVISGNGLTGGGDLSADRTLAVGAGTGISVAADSVAIDKATEANMEAQASNKVVTADIMKHHLGVAKAWASFGVTGALQRSYNVTSVTDNGTGDWTINFTTAMASADYAVLGTIESTSAVIFRVFDGGRATGSVRVQTVNTSNVLTDPSGEIFVAVYSDL